MAKEEHIEDLMMESSAVLLDRGLLMNDTNNTSHQTCNSEHYGKQQQQRREVDIKIEHERSVNVNVERSSSKPNNEEQQQQQREEERIEEITVDYVISTNEQTGEAMIEAETSQVFEKIHTAGGPDGAEILISDRSEFRQRHLYDDDVIEIERQKLEEEILKREIEGFPHFYF